MNIHGVPKLLRDHREIDAPQIIKIGRKNDKTMQAREVICIIS